LGGKDPVEVVEAQDLEDVEDGLVELGETDVAAVAPDLLDRPHDRAETRARDVGQPGAVDHDLEAVLLEGLLDLPLEHPDRVGVDEARRIEQGDVLELARLDLEFGHQSGGEKRKAVTSPARAHAQGALFTAYLTGDGKKTPGETWDSPPTLSGRPGAAEPLSGSHFGPCAARASTPRASSMSRRICSSRAGTPANRRSS